MSNLLFESDLISENGKKNRSCEQNYQNSETVSIKFRSVSSARSLTLSEGIKSNSRKSYGYARVTPRRFASTHTVDIWNLQSSNLSGVNSPAVIPAWGLSRPRVNFFATDGDIHREFDADLLNLVPADGSFTKRVGDCDALVEDSYLWADKAKIKEIADQQAPTKGCDEAFNSLNKETLRGDTGTEKIDKSGEKVTTSRAVDLRISHANSLSRKVVR